MKGPAVVVALLVCAGLMLIACGGDGQSAPRVRIVLASTETADSDVSDEALEEIREIIERRLGQLGLARTNVQRAGANRIAVELPDVTLAGLDDAISQAAAEFGSSPILQFCEPVTNAAGDVAIVREGAVQYEPGTCQPVRDAAENIVVEGGTLEFAPWARSSTPQAGDNPRATRIVWQPARAEIDGVQIELSSRLLRPNTFVFLEPVLNRPILRFELTSQGRDVLEQVTARLVERNYPLALFLDGKPVPDSNGLPIAPTVQGVITSQGNIDGLDVSEAQELATLLNTEGLSPLLNIEAFPLPMQAVEVQEVTD